MKKGFTLIEIMVAISVFIIVMTISMASILSIFGANSSSEAQKAVFDNLSNSLESMAREIRFGSNYHCETDEGGGGNAGNLSQLSQPNDCQDFTNGAGRWITFLAENGQEITYRFNGQTQAIERSTDLGVTFIPVTSPDVAVSGQSYFFVVGSNPPSSGDTRQPSVFILINGSAGDPAKPASQSTFTIQTRISQRKLDH